LEIVVIDTKTEIERHLSALVNLHVSAVSHAADMLTLHFGPQKQYTTRRGTVLGGGAWALHVQCDWQIVRLGDIVATQNDLSEAAHRAVQKIHDLLVASGPARVESVVVSELGGATISMSNDLRLVITPTSVPGDEDWRLFKPDSDAKHFVIEGGKVDPWSLS
jgi:hypothetical protein